MKKVFKITWSFVGSPPATNIIIAGVWSPRRKEERIYVNFGETDHVRSLIFLKQRALLDLKSYTVCPEPFLGNLAWGKANIAP